MILKNHECLENFWKCTVWNCTNPGFWMAVYKVFVLLPSLTSVSYFWIHAWFPQGHILTLEDRDISHYHAPLGLFTVKKLCPNDLLHNDLILQGCSDISNNRHHWADLDYGDFDLNWHLKLSTKTFVFQMTSSERGDMESVCKRACVCVHVHIHPIASLQTEASHQQLC